MDHQVTVESISETSTAAAIKETTQTAITTASQTVTPTAITTAPLTTPTSVHPFGNPLSTVLTVKLDDKNYILWRKMILAVLKG